MPPPQVWLGLPGDLASPEVPSDHYSTRIGGPPVFLGTTVPQWVGCAAGSSPKCAVCGTPLSLVLQAYAPLPDLPDRVLLVFGCTKAGCGKGPGCWQALRCQLPQQRQQQQQQQQQEATHPTQPTQPTQQSTTALNTASGSATSVGGGTGFDAGVDDWGCGTAPADSGFGATDFGFGGGWDAPQQPAGSNGSNAFDFSDLTSALTATIEQQQQHQKKATQRKREQKKKQLQDAAAAADSANASAAGSSKGAAGPELPEFYLYAELEPDGSSTQATPSKELQHVQQLLAAYEAAEGAGSSSGSSQKPPAAAATAAGGDADAEGGASWAGEEYEPDSVQCMQRSYLKFMKRIARQPQQCARYSHDGPLLWPKSKAPQPSPCPQCGGPRVFELQLMPALSQMVLEAAGMLQEQDLTVNAAAEEVLVVTEAECETAVQAGPPAAGTGPAAGAAESQPDEDETGSDVA